jgi:hypothetical protein
LTSLSSPVSSSQARASFFVATLADQIDGDLPHAVAFQQLLLRPLRPLPDAACHLPVNGPAGRSGVGHALEVGQDIG